MASSTEGITVSVKTAKQKVEISIKADANVGDVSIHAQCYRFVYLYEPVEVLIATGIGHGHSALTFP